MLPPTCFWKCSLCFHLPPLQGNQWVSASKAVMAGVGVCGLTSTPPPSPLPSGACILEKRPPSVLIFKVAEVRVSLKALFSSPLMCSLHLSFRLSFPLMCSLHLSFRLSFDALTCGPHTQCKVSCDGASWGGGRADQVVVDAQLGWGMARGKGGTYRAGVGSCGQLGTAVG